MQTSELDVARAEIARLTEKNKRLRVRVEIYEAAGRQMLQQMGNLLDLMQRLLVDAIVADVMLGRRTVAEQVVSCLMLDRIESLSSTSTAPASPPPPPSPPPH